MSVVNEVKIKRAATDFVLRGTGPETSRTLVQRVKVKRTSPPGPLPWQFGSNTQCKQHSPSQILINGVHVNFMGWMILRSSPEQNDVLRSFSQAFGENGRPTAHLNSCFPYIVPM